MWCIWTGAQWVSVYEEWQIENAREMGYEVRFIAPQLGEYDPNAEVPLMVAQGLEVMERYLAGV